MFARVLVSMKNLDSRLYPATIPSDRQMENSTMTNRWIGQVAAGRTVAYTKGGVVASTSPLAASTGIQVMKEGGNAFDAAVATAAVEAVALFPLCGVGGEAMVLMYEAKTNRIYGLSGSGRAPGAATRDFYVQQGYKAMPLEGAQSVAIPGEIDAYETILGRFGTKTLAQLLEPAIGYAEEGYPVYRRTSGYYFQGLDKVNRYPDSARNFTKSGLPYMVGEVFVQKDLARSLRRIAQGGSEEFYRGDLAREMVQALQAAGGQYTLEDWAAHKSILYNDPISTIYRGHTVYEANPPSQGLLVLEILNIIEGFDVASLGLITADRIHLMVEAAKLAYADRNKFIRADSPSDTLKRILSKEHAASRASRIDFDRASQEVEADLVETAAGDENTSYFCVIDGQGNAVSFIHSLSNPFGSGFTAGNTGILFNNRLGRGFSLVEGHPNVMEPNKHTMHTINPYMVFKDDKPYFLGGTPGGDSQPHWNTQVISNIIDFGMDVQQAASVPRWFTFPGTDPSDLDKPFVLLVEKGIPDDVQQQLGNKGHNVQLYPEEIMAGATQLIMADQETGVRMGGSDPRDDGHAAVT